MCNEYKFKFQIITLLWSNSSPSTNIPVLSLLFWWRPIGRGWIAWKNSFRNEMRKLWEMNHFYSLFWYMFVTQCFGKYLNLRLIRVSVAVTLSVVSHCFAIIIILAGPIWILFWKWLRLNLPNFCLNFPNVCNWLGDLGHIQKINFWGYFINTFIIQGR